MRGREGIEVRKMGAGRWKLLSVININSHYKVKLQ